MVKGQGMTVDADQVGTVQVLVRVGAADSAVVHLDHGVTGVRLRRFADFVEAQVAPPVPAQRVHTDHLRTAFTVTQLFCRKISTRIVILGPRQGDREKSAEDKQERYDIDAGHGGRSGLRSARAV